MDATKYLDLLPETLIQEAEKSLAFAEYPTNDMPQSYQASRDFFLAQAQILALIAIAKSLTGKGGD
jgi:hypothetical protein